MKFFYLHAVISFLLLQSMDIDESIFKTSMSNMFEDTELVNLSMSNFKEHPGLSSYDYCTLEELAGFYNYLGFEVNKLAFKVDEKSNFK